jgi:hypothetical protein
MKITTPLLAAAMIFSSAQACIRLHVNAGYSPLSEDGMRVQIWDNNDYYDIARVGHDGANGNTHFQFNFKNGYYAELWDNGRAGFVSAPGMFTPFLQKSVSVMSVWNHLIMLSEGYSY